MAPRLRQWHDLLVLGYHAIAEDWRASLSVRPELLEAQLGLLTRRGYRGRRISEALACPSGGRTVVVTFDDGYASMLTRAAPVLARLGLPGTVYVPTDWPGRGSPMSWPGVERWSATEHACELTSLTWDQIRELDALGWEIGAHTCSHPHLTQVGDDQLRRELADSRRRVEDELGKPCVSLAYPYGDVDDRVALAARTAGFENAVTLPRARDLLRKGDALRTPRVPIHRVDDLRRFRAKVSPGLRRLRASRAAALVAGAVATVRG